MQRKSFLYALHLLIQQSLQIEWRKRQFLPGTILYLCALLLVIYLSVDHYDFHIFMGLFWVSELFILLHFTQKSTEQHKEATDAFYYFLVPPEIYIGAKITFNAVLSMIFSVVNAFFFLVLFGHFDLPLGWFLLTLIGGNIGLSALFSFISTLSQNTESPSSLSILSIPLLLPLLMLSLQVSTLLPHTTLDSIYLPLGALYLLDLLIIALSLILYRSLWQL